MIDVSISREEVFEGEVTGDVNITELKAWLKTTNHKTTVNAFEMWNAKDMLAHHDFDESAQPRIDSLLEMDKFEPLITVQDKDGAIYLIDGWHRLYILYEVSLHHEKLHVPFECYVVTPEDCAQFPITNKTKMRIAR